MRAALLATALVLTHGFAPRPASLRAPHRAASRSLVRPAAANDYDVVVVGSGLGGLTCSALLAMYGKRVLCLEAHVHAGGCAHGFRRKTSAGTYVFDSGPSFWFGMSKPTANPLRVAMDALGVADRVEWAMYDGWSMYTPSGDWRFTANDNEFSAAIERADGAAGLAQWKRLKASMAPVASVGMAIPPMGMRADPGAVVTLAAYAGAFARAVPIVSKLNGAFGMLLDEAAVPEESFLFRFMDFFSFALSGLPARSTMAAATATSTVEILKDDGIAAKLEYPIGGSEAVVDALVHGLEKHGGSLRLSAPVASIEVVDGKATGVTLESGERIAARDGVVSNADVWSTLKLLGPDALPDRVRNEVGERTPETDSFMHLHLAIDATGLPDDLDIHHSIVFDESVPVNAPDNVVLVSIPTMLDPSLCPAGQHIIHTYTAACTPFDDFKDLDPKSEAYRAYKDERAEVLWRAVEKVIPDVRQRAVLTMVGSPLTHARFLRRHRGTFGPAWDPGKGQVFPGNKALPIDGLLLASDSTFPGIGVPAAAASGTIAANSMAELGPHLAALRRVQAMYRGIL